LRFVRVRNLAFLDEGRYHNLTGASERFMAKELAEPLCDGRELTLFAVEGARHQTAARL
jgi:hypothetical protein